MQINSTPAFKYLGIKVNQNNILEEEIKETLLTVINHIMLFNQCLEVKLISKNAKGDYIKPFIRPVVRYTSVTWVLKAAIKQ